MFTLKLKPPVLLSLAIGLFVVLAAACGSSQEQARSEANAAPSKQPVKIAPGDAAKLEQLAVMADEMYKLTMKGSYLEARSKLLDMGTQATRIHYEGVTSVGGVQALTQTITEAQRTFNNVKFDENEAKLQAAKLKLASDALTHRNEPMWLQYDKVLQEDMASLAAGIRSGEAKAVQDAVSALKSHFGVVRPAVLISKEPQIVERIDSLLTFLTNQSKATPLQKGNLENGAEQLQKAFDELFGKKDASAYLPLTDYRRPILWSVVIGSVIAAILAYSAWQMFRDGRGEISIRRKGDGS
jgi:sporulation protein YpjB